MSENLSRTQPTEAGLFSAADLKRRMVEREAAKAAEEARHMQEQEEKQKAVMAEFHKPPERTADQLMQLVMGLVSHAAERGQSEVQVYRFPIAAAGSTTRSMTGRRPSKVGPNSATNSGTIISGRSALV
jgi:hypothetical protein